MNCTNCYAKVSEGQEFCPICSDNRKFKVEELARLKEIQELEIQRAKEGLETNRLAKEYNEALLERIDVSSVSKETLQEYADAQAYRVWNKVQYVQQCKSQNVAMILGGLLAGGKFDVDECLRKAKELAEDLD